MTLSMNRARSLEKNMRPGKPGMKRPPYPLISREGTPGWQNKSCQGFPPA